jgi:hypothetical protein
LFFLCFAAAFFVHASEFLKQISINSPDMPMLAVMAYMPSTGDPVESVMRPSM